MNRSARLLGVTALVWAGSTSAALAQAGGGFQFDIGHVFFAIAVVVGLILMIPTFIAFYRQHPNRWLIGVINVVFGPTLFGWLICLVWALDAAHRSPTGNHGGESGLNLFANDVQDIRLVQTPEASSAAQPEPQGHQSSRTEPADPHADDTAQLKRLKQLFEQGLLDQDEYGHLKGQVIDRIMAR